MSWSQRHIDKTLEIVKKDSNQTRVEFARNKEQLFDRWCCSKKIDQNYDKLRQLVLVEEFKRCIQSDVKTFLDEKQVETLEKSARLANDYYLTRKVSFIAKPKPTSSHLHQGVECGTGNIPLHHVNLSSDLVTGLVVIGIKPSLPFKGVHLLLGNNLTGDKVVVNPLVTDTPNIGQIDDPIEQEIPDLYPSCAVTRAMAKKAILKNSNSDIDLMDTFIGQYFNNEIKKSLDPSLSDTQTNSSMSYHSPPRSIDQGHDTLSKSQFV